MSALHRGLRVLIVDDEEDMCWALKTIVETEGHRAVSVSNAQEALRQLRAASFDLAFVDLKLPDMEGIELIAGLRALLPDLPCFLVSGYLYDDDETVQTACKAGLIRGFIGKPFPLAQVRQAFQLAHSS